MSNGRIGYKSKLAWGDGATPTEVFTEIAEQLSVEPADTQTDEVEFSNQDSLDFRKEFKPSWIDGGELTVTCNYIPGDTTQAKLRDDRDGQIIRNWRINVADPLTGDINETITFQGWVKSFKLGTISPADRLECSGTIRVTGPETWVVTP
jgi:Lambda phage tail tube protein, TTP